MRGFLGTGATFSADLNLLLQVAMGVALVAGALLARRRHYAAHGICQTTVMILNLVTIVWVMGPSFREQVIRFTNWKRWMRIELGLWWVVVLTGIWTYAWWYMVWPAR